MNMVRWAKQLPSLKQRENYNHKQFIKTIFPYFSKHNQSARNHTVQYYAYPDYKFDTLRKIAPGMYETSAPVNSNEWITMRIEVTGEKVYLYINDAKYSTFVVDKMKGKTTHGSIALWVDIGTIGYFKDLKVTKK